MTFRPDLGQRLRIRQQLWGVLQSFETQRTDYHCCGPTIAGQVDAFVVTLHPVHDFRQISPDLRQRHPGQTFVGPAPGQAEESSCALTRYDINVAW